MLKLLVGVSVAESVAAMSVRVKLLELPLLSVPKALLSSKSQ